MAKRLPSLTALESMTLAELQSLWLRVYRENAPSWSPDLLRRGLAYKLQEKKLGGLNRTVKTHLERDGDRASPDKPKLTLGSKLSVGTKLVRDWHGVGHSITVVEDGFEYDGKQWKSLTAIAREITGTKWSGLRFFGLLANGFAK